MSVLRKPKAIKEYKRAFTRFMSFYDQVDYDISRQFSTERLLELSAEDVYDFFAYVAYVIPAPGPEDQAPLARADTILGLKKAISFFMPRKKVRWDEVTRTGNPTQGSDVNSLIDAIKLAEARGLGVKSQSKMPLMFNEFVKLIKSIQMLTMTLKKLVKQVLTLM